MGEVGGVVWVWGVGAWTASRTMDIPIRKYRGSYLGWLVGWIARRGQVRLITTTYYVDRVRQDF